MREGCWRKIRQAGGVLPSPMIAWSPCCRQEALPTPRTSGPLASSSSTPHNPETHCSLAVLEGLHMTVLPGTKPFLHKQVSDPDTSQDEQLSLSRSASEVWPMSSLLQTSSPQTSHEELAGRR